MRKHRYGASGEYEDMIERLNFTLEDLGDIPSEKKMMFMSNILSVAECYKNDSNSKGTLILTNQEGLIIMPINANHMEVAGMAMKSSELLADWAKQDAPEIGKYN